MQRQELRQKLLEPGHFKEVWLEHESGSQLRALVAGDIGWLMYIREAEDAGYSSRNPGNSSTSLVEFQLGNGQVDSFPENWTYPTAVLLAAMESYLESGELPEEVEWHDDSVVDVT